MKFAEVVEKLNAEVLELENTIAVQSVTIENVMNKNCPGDSKEDLDKEENKDHVKIIIDLDTKGTYNIKEWHDPKMDYELDGMILEIFKDDKGQLKMVHWTEDELLDISKEMLTFWDDDEFWDQVTIGYIGDTKAVSEFNMYDDAMKKWRKNKK